VSIRVHHRIVATSVFGDMAAAALVGVAKEGRVSRRKEHQLVDPTMSGATAIEYSIHKVLPRMIPDLEKVFPGVDLTEALVIPTFQQCKCDLVANGPEPDAEKDRLLESFVAWSRAICTKLRDMGHWADLTDPCSGLPVYTERGGSFYPDVIGGQMLLAYDMIDTGCCKLLSHPRWQTKVYPATMFTTAPLDVATAILANPPPPAADGFAAAPAPMTVE